MKKIKTGADKLVDIIQETKRISLDDAAKALGASKSLVQEWAEFLEKEKLISIDYSFSKVFLVERKLSSGEIKESAKEILSEKEGIVRKLEYAIASLDKESVDFDEIKKKFNKVHGDVKEEIKTVEKELVELEKYKDLKTSIDKDIENQKKKYEEELAKLNTEIKNKESDFVDLYSKIISEKEKIKDHKSRISSLQKSQKEIEDSIKTANSIFLKLKDDLKHEEYELVNKQKYLDKLEGEFDHLGGRVIKEKKKKIASVFDSFEKDSKKLLKRQDELLQDAKEKVARLRSYEDVGKKIKSGFDGFFSKTVKIYKKMDEIDSDKEELKKNLDNLYKKAKALDVMSSSSSLSKQVKSLFEEIKKQEAAKTKLVNKIKSLFNDLRL